MANALIHILVIEDDEEEFLLLQELFRTQNHYARDNFHIEFANSIPIAMEKLADAQWDLFIVDYHLGRSNGIEFILEVASAGVRVPALLVTGQKDLEIPVEAQALMSEGRMRFLHKGDLNWKTLEEGMRVLVSRTLTLLMVDDDAEDFEILRDALRDTALVHFEVKHAESVAAARNLLRERNFDVIVLDHQLAGEVGSELMPDIEGLVPRPYTVICSSSDAAPKDPRFSRAMAAGHAGVFNKSGVGSRYFANYLLGASRFARLGMHSYRPTRG